MTQYYVRDENDGTFTLRQTRFKDTHHPHDVMAVARSRAELKAMCEATGLEYPEEPKRFAKALAIVNPGAVNPSGIALTLHEACKECIAEGVQQRTDPAVRLMVHQLAYLCQADTIMDPDEYARLVGACKRQA